MPRPPRWPALSRPRLVSRPLAESQYARVTGLWLTSDLTAPVWHVISRSIAGDSGGPGVERAPRGRKPAETAGAQPDGLAAIATAAEQRSELIRAALDGSPLGSALWTTLCWALGDHFRIPLFPRQDERHSGRGEKAPRWSRRGPRQEHLPEPPQAPPESCPWAVGWSSLPASAALHHGHPERLRGLRHHLATIRSNPSRGDAWASASPWPWPSSPRFCQNARTPESYPRRERRINTLTAAMTEAKNLQWENLQRNRLAVSQEVKPGHPFLAYPISERPSARFARPVPWHTEARRNARRRGRRRSGWRTLGRPVPFPLRWRRSRGPRPAWVSARSGSLAARGRRPPLAGRVRSIATIPLYTSGGNSIDPPASCSLPSRVDRAL